ncbi:GNAT family N-acetyltransferase [Planococcus faecalis]|uniref:GNAT family N-acetyltransferase n=1 Tax=Planococcus faecalis TaxID=1598147 RepID=A0ABM6IU61_9BACL|nr:GNAT family N-acetyltransferase [Planococcus faecalis]AQU80126.1 GNAT family N-acetyltransferase [Planococcus faecalis]OHX52573.1 acetyltransferase [Planococcus faecalis]
MTHLTLHTGYQEEDTYFMKYKLITHNKNLIDYTEEEKVNFMLKDEEENILGGLVGHIDWECFFVDILWVDESLRGLGKGQQLIQEAEDYARKKDCRLIRLETFSFQAPAFYKKLGFKEMGKLEDFPKGYTHYYLYKELT